MHLKFIHVYGLFSINLLTGLAMEKISISAVKSGELGKMTSKLTKEESGEVAKITKEDKTCVVKNVRQHMVIGELFMLNQWLDKNRNYETTKARITCCFRIPVSCSQTRLIHWRYRHEAEEYHALLAWY